MDAFAALAPHLAGTSSRLLNLAREDQRPLPPELMQRARDLAREFREIWRAAIDAIEDGALRAHWLAVEQERLARGGEAVIFSQEELADLWDRLRADAFAPLKERNRVHTEKAAALLADFLRFAETRSVGEGATT